MPQTHHPHLRWLRRLLRQRKRKRRTWWRLKLLREHWMEAIGW
jgi:hypothetical protein